MIQERVNLASPFPGMDPYLERPDLWPDVHNRLIAASARTRRSSARAIRRLKSDVPENPENWRWSSRPHRGAEEALSEPDRNPDSSPSSRSSSHGGARPLRRI
jgi:hypothetical protein